MKAAQHAKQQTERSRNALLAHAAMARALVKARRTAEAQMQIRGLTHGRPMYWRLNADHTTSPIYGRMSDDASAALEWAQDFENFEDRQLARDEIEGCLISTIFLGLDHAWGGGPPVLFETMAFSAAAKLVKLFGGREREVHEEIEQRRYCTYDEAMAGHQDVVAHVRKTVARLNALKATGE
jgi:hypothetical protein